MASPTLSTGMRSRLSIMMFLQYAFQGAWVIPVATYLGKVGYTGGEIGAAFGAIAIGFIVSPFFVGMIADRFFSAQKVLGVANVLAAVLLYIASQVAVDAQGNPQADLFFWVMLAHCLCYTPTWALTNTIALNQMTNPGRQFPSIRVMGTFGWIAISLISVYSALIMPLFGIAGNIEETKVPMMIGSGIGLLAGLLSFIMPDTPPKGVGQKITFGDIIGVKALHLFKDRNFLVFAITSFGVVVIGLFYWAFGNKCLTEMGMRTVMTKQALGQSMEVIFLYLMPLFFARYGVKKMLMVGIIAWVARFICFGFGDGGSMMFLLYGGIILHGICFDFFFVTGQLYTDKKADKKVQASAQALITLITFGLGWYVGSELSGTILDKYVTADFRSTDILIEAKYKVEVKGEDGESTEVEKPGFYGHLIADAATSSTSVAARIMTSLTPEALKLVTEGAASEKLDAENKVTFSDELTEILKKPDFYKVSDFEKPSGPTKALLALAPADISEEQIMDLNRSVLETAYPLEIAQRRHDWKNIFYWPVCIGIGILLFFLLFFNDDLIVSEEKKDDDE